MLERTRGPTAAVTRRRSGTLAPSERLFIFVALDGRDELAMSLWAPQVEASSRDLPSDKARLALFEVWIDKGAWRPSTASRAWNQIIRMNALTFDS